MLSLGCVIIDTIVISSVHILQYTVTINSSSLTLRESFSITVGPVTSLAVSPDQTVIYALTPNKVCTIKILGTVQWEIFEG